MENRIIRPGDIYKHFKGKLYQIITVAVHSENSEKMVVYQALYGDFKTYVRPYDMFISQVDKDKYKDVSQEYRFMKVQLGEKENLEEVRNESMEDKGENTLNVLNSDSHSDMLKDRVNPFLMEFLEAESYQEKLSIVKNNRSNITDNLLNDMAASLDVTVEEGEIDGRIDGFIFCLQTFVRFEDRRLR